MNLPNGCRFGAIFSGLAAPPKESSPGWPDKYRLARRGPQEPSRAKFTRAIDPTETAGQNPRAGVLTPFFRLAQVSKQGYFGLNSAEIAAGSTGEMMPFSVIRPRIRAAGVTSKAGQ